MAVWRHKHQLVRKRLLSCCRNITKDHRFHSCGGFCDLCTPAQTRTGITNLGGSRSIRLNHRVRTYDKSAGLVTPVQHGLLFWLTIDTILHLEWYIGLAICASGVLPTKTSGTRHHGRVRVFGGNCIILLV